MLVNTRLAADAVGATKMDRCEDVEPHPKTGRVYVACTNNTDRGAAGKEGATEVNPRKSNRDGHIVEITEAGNDATATTFGWSLLLVCGDPAVNGSTYFAGFPAEKVSPISCPDNVAFDSDGNLWISTDGAPSTIGYCDGLFKVPLEGPERGQVQQFLSCLFLFFGPARVRDLRTGHPRQGRQRVRRRPAPRRERHLGRAALLLPGLRRTGNPVRGEVGRPAPSGDPDHKGLIGMDAADLRDTLTVPDKLPTRAARPLEREIAMTFWDFIVGVFRFYILFTCITIFITIFVDVFRDKTIGGGAKAGWVIFLILVPFLSVFTYLIACRDSMGQRASAAAQAAAAQNAAYIQSVAAPSSAVDEIAQGLQGPPRLRRDHAVRVRQPQGRSNRLIQQPAATARCCTRVSDRVPRLGLSVVADAPIGLHLGDGCQAVCSLRIGLLRCVLERELDPGPEQQRAVLADHDIQLRHLPDAEIVQRSCGCADGFSGCILPGPTHSCR